MPGYMIARIEVTDWERYRQYTKATPAAIAKYGGKFLVRGGDVLTLEGPAEKRRLVVLEFPSVEQAQTFYRSPEYSAAKKLRADAAVGEFLIVEGCEQG